MWRPVMEKIIPYERAIIMREEELIEVNLAIDRYIEIIKRNE